jgi:predicted ATPase
VLLSGEPGIGKSRLVQELTEQLGREGVTRLELRCSPYHQNSALYPIINHLQRLLQFAREDTPAVKLEKLQHTLNHYRFPQADTVPLLASLLSLPHPEGYLPITASPQKQKEKTQAALVAWLVEEAEQAAVYCTWEDLHWADPSTLEVLTLLLDQVPTTRLLALLTCRPEFTPPWGNRSHLSQLTLSRLGRPQVETMVAHVTRGKALPAEVVQQIVAKTDGVPLFVEELTKTVLESRLVREKDGHYELAGPLPPLAIPTTLHDSLMARLDRLATVKEVAQIGAVLGREFSYELIQAVAPVDEPSLQQALAKLVEAEVLYQRGLPLQARYLFKHALIQDAAYQSLLKSTRQHYHNKIAQVLEERFPEAKETQPELLAHHYTEAGLTAQAIPYWQRAGERATQHSAYVEAINHLTRGLELLKTLPDTPERIQQELTLQITLSAPLQATRGYASPEVERTWTRAQELCQQIGETPHLFRVLSGRWNVSFIQAQCQTTRERAEQLLTLAQGKQDLDLLLKAYEALGTTLYILGELVPAREYLEQSLALYDSQKCRFPASLDLSDHWVASRSYAAWLLWSLGYPDQALQRSHEALTVAQELSRPFSLAFALHGTAQLHLLRREGRAGQERAEAMMALSHEQGFPFWLAMGAMHQGCALAEQGQVEEGMAQMHQGMAAYRTTGAEVGRPSQLARLARAYGKMGQAEEGLAAVAEALATVNKTGERISEAELYRLQGELTLQRETRGWRLETSPAFAQASSLKPQVSREVAQEAEQCFHKALEIARRQSAKSLELRATVSLARLWQQQGKRREARQLLAEIYHWFTEGFDTKDLQEAKALLEELQ